MNCLAYINLKFVYLVICKQMRFWLTFYEYKVYQAVIIETNEYSDVFKTSDGIELE